MSSNKKKYALGLMSGTSADGVSVAAVTTERFSVAAIKTYPYPKNLQAEIISAPQLTARGLSRLNFALGKIFAEKTVLFLKEHGIKPSEVEVIGSHGQTICHYPAMPLPHTLQLGEPSFLSEFIGVPVVSDFRPRDMAAGGEGAPLAPLYHAAMCATLDKPVMVLNWGGVGNVTYLGASGEIVAFDTGPANALIDDFVARRLGANCDEDGRLAAAGRIDETIVESLMRDSYFDRAPPKSLDRNHFHAAAQAVATGVSGGSTPGAPVHADSPEN